MDRTHRVGLALSSILRRDGGARRDPCGANLEALLPVPFRFGSDGLVGVTGSGFTVMLDLPLSVLEPVMELKREVSSGRGIVTACNTATRAVTKTRVPSIGECHSTHVSMVGIGSRSGHCPQL